MDLPVDPFKIAEREGIVVRAKKTTTPGVSGLLMKVGDTFGIMYAMHLSNDGFIRFTVSHELGHYFLPGHAEHLFAGGVTLHESHSGFISHDQYEIEADSFAASLLMPPKLFRQAMRNAGIGFTAIETLTDTCRTSITATAIRYATHTDDPVAVVVSPSDRIDYCFMSENLKNIRGLQWIRKGELLPNDTATWRFNRDPANIESRERVESACSLDDWFDGAPDLEVNEDVVGLGSYGKTLTVLFSDEPIDGEDYEDDD
ncbi:MAG: ImmA/IrrE family metallo-endopeptidase [Pirellulaceae bacterium]